MKREGRRRRNRWDTSRAVSLPRGDPCTRVSHKCAWFGARNAFCFVSGWRRCCGARAQTVAVTRAVRVGRNFRVRSDEKRLAASRAAQERTSDMAFEYPAARRDESKVSVQQFAAVEPQWESGEWEPGSARRLTALV